MTKNAVEQVLVAEFSDPGLWHEAPTPRMRCIRSAGLAYDISHVNDFKPDTVTPIISIEPDKHWVAGSYGDRIRVGSDSDLRFEQIGLTTLVKLHAALGNTVMAGENIHYSTLVAEPEPHEKFTNRINNNLWLAKIANGEWPFMTAHDYRDAHAFNSVFFPRELQDLETMAAEIELEWRSNFQYDEDIKVLLLPGERAAEPDRYLSGFGGQLERRHSGIKKIDLLHDVEEYPDALHFAMQGDSPAAVRQRVDTIAEYAGAIRSGFCDRADSRFLPAVGMKSLMLCAVDLMNFVSRHNNRHEATPEMVAETESGVIEGVKRVAVKISGQ